MFYWRFKTGNYTLNHGLAENLDDKCNEILASCDAGMFHFKTHWTHQNDLRK